MTRARTITGALLLTGLLTVGGCANEEEHEPARHAAHWGYEGAEGPSHWGDLNPEWILCKTGRNQSPIDLSGLIEGELPPLHINYRPDATEILNNGHTVQVNYRPGSTLTVDGHHFTLRQFHFHAPSENTIDGRAFPMEAHLVHADAQGNLAVVAVMFEEGAANPALTLAFSHMPEKAGDKHAFSAETVNAADLLPADRDYYRYNGSLTTPPCSEGVWWLVMKQPMTASKAQIEHFRHVMHHPNNRPVQPINARPVLK